MDTLEAVKDRAQFFKRGSIIPARIIKCSKRKFQHFMKFGSGCWVLPTPTGYVCIIDEKQGDSAIRIDRSKAKTGAMRFDGSPYHGEGRCTRWVGSFNQTKEEFEARVMQELYGISQAKPIGEPK